MLRTLVVLLALVVAAVMAGNCYPPAPSGSSTSSSTSSASSVVSLCQLPDGFQVDPDLKDVCENFNAGHFSETRRRGAADHNEPLALWEQMHLEALQALQHHRRQDAGTAAATTGSPADTQFGAQCRSAVQSDGLTCWENLVSVGCTMSCRPATPQLLFNYICRSQCDDLLNSCKSSAAQGCFDQMEQFVCASGESNCYPQIEANLDAAAALLDSDNAGEVGADVNEEAQDTCADYSDSCGSCVSMTDCAFCTREQDGGESFCYNQTFDGPHPCGCGTVRTMCPDGGSVLVILLIVFVVVCCCIFCVIGVGILFFGVSGAAIAGGFLYGIMACCDPERQPREVETHVQYSGLLAESEDE